MGACSGHFMRRTGIYYSGNNICQKSSFRRIPDQGPGQAPVSRMNLTGCRIGSGMTVYLFGCRSNSGKLIIFGETAIMNLRKWFGRLSVENQGLNYKLSVIFGLFFLAPVAGFMYFAIKYDILSDQHIPLYFLVLLIFSFFGFIILRKLFDEIIRVSKTISQTIAEEFSPAQTLHPEDELKSIVHSFQTIERELRDSFRHLEKKTSDISTLRELRQKTPHPCAR
jgi:hypothetical protein